MCIVKKVIIVEIDDNNYKGTYKKFLLCFIKIPSNDQLQDIFSTILYDLLFIYFLQKIY